MAPEASKPSLGEQQQALVDDYRADLNLFGTGMAGTGKSFVLKEMMDATLTVCASTGIAALNVGGMTLHRFCGLGYIQEHTTARSIYKRLKQAAKDGRSRVLDAIRSLRRLAIDEISMVGRRVLEIVDELFRLIREDQRAFGGVQIIMFGDFLQLPPVKDDWAFKSAVWSHADFKFHFLSKVYRQADQHFSDILNKVRLGSRQPNGDIDQDVADVLKERLATKPPTDCPPIDVHTHNGDVDWINMGRLKDMGKDIKIFQAREFGQDWAKEMMEKECRAPRDLHLSIGARVMLLINLAPEAGLANGSLGTVKSFGKDTITVEFDSGAVQEISTHNFEKKDHSQIVAERLQFPLRLAWAITSHKSQGLTFDRATVHLAACFAAGQAYVALSRVKTLDGLFIANSRRGAIKTDQEALEFYENGGVWIPEQAELFA